MSEISGHLTDWKAHVVAEFFAAFAALRKPTKSGCKPLSGAAHAIVNTLINATCHQPSDPKKPFAAKLSGLTERHLTKLTGLDRSTRQEAVADLVAAGVVWLEAASGCAGIVFDHHEWKGVDAEILEAQLELLCGPRGRVKQYPIFDQSTLPAASAAVSETPVEQVNQDQQCGENPAPSAGISRAECGDSPPKTGGIYPEAVKQSPPAPLPAKLLDSGFGVSASSAETTPADGSRAEAGAEDGELHTPEKTALENQLAADASPPSGAGISRGAGKKRRMRAADPAEDPHAWCIRAGIGELGSDGAPGKRDYDYDDVIRPCTALASIIRTRWLETVDPARFAAAVQALKHAALTVGVDDPVAYIVTAYKSAEGLSAGRAGCKLWQRWAYLRAENALYQPPEDAQARVLYDSEWRERSRAALDVERDRIAAADAERRKAEQAKLRADAEKLRQEDGDSAQKQDRQDLVRALKRLCDGVPDADVYEALEGVPDATPAMHGALNRWLKDRRPNSGGDYWQDLRDVYHALPSRSALLLFAGDAVKTPLAVNHSVTLSHTHTNLKKQIDRLAAHLLKLSGQLHAKPSRGSFMPSPKKGELLAAELRRLRVSDQQIVFMVGLSVDAGQSSVWSDRQRRDVLQAAAKAGLCEFRESESAPITPALMMPVDAVPVEAGA